MMTNIEPINTQENVVLSQLKSAKLALTEVTELDKASVWYKTISAYNDVIKAMKVTHDVKVEACELRIRWERRLGEIIKTSPKNKGIKMITRDEGGSIVNPPSNQDTTPTLKELGVTKAQADRARKLSAIPENEFEAMLTERREDALKEANKAVERKLSTNSMIRELRQKERGDSEPAFSPIIKPSDNWNFANVQYPRIDEEGDGHWGYIPGDLYANCLWYYTDDGDKVVAPMAGSGQIIRVWEDKETWMKGDEWDIDLRCFDLNPRGIYKDKIQYNDLTQCLPVSDVDYIVMDVPYFGMVENQYSDKSQDIANAQNYEEWLAMMMDVADSCLSALKTGGLLTVITPNYRDIPSSTIYICTSGIILNFSRKGFTIFDKAYASRRIQQAQNPNMARMNNLAKKNRVMLTDMAEVITFIKD